MPYKRLWGRLRRVVDSGTGIRSAVAGRGRLTGMTRIRTRYRGPTDWKLHEGDVMPVAQLTAEHLTKFYRVVLPDGYGHYESERYVPWAGDGEEKFPKQSMPTLEWIMKLFGQPEGDGDGNDYLAVVVDTAKQF